MRRFPNRDAAIALADSHSHESHLPENDGPCCPRAQIASAMGGDLDRSSTQRAQGGSTRSPRSELPARARSYPFLYPYGESRPTRLRFCPAASQCSRMNSA